MELFFFESGLTGSLAPDDAYANAAKEKIWKAAESIRQGKFHADPEYLACNYCAYSGICPSAEVLKT